ncbi:MULTISPECIES: cytochrome c oxidase subunit 3 [unclassified Rhizobium]|uniref:cytochrome c oxidase subunit 3 n=1 Tax=unclassified Rhizobium TaxID=2613769 RepID=UPI0006FA3FCF|nr:MULTISPECIES: cytochrome c oxidase subunit 3 [unclassified Rhizobium]KQV39996.1 cytochrome C oxidase [Rhizobium sp. Root1212]KRD31707.1 cytochrome C oxidase [Rhizobium sp. Root268]
MTVMLSFLAVILAIIAWWMAGQRLASKPWLESSSAQTATDRERPFVPAINLGLYVFLGVVAALFSLFISAYFMRMASSDWWGIPVPRLLWWNTAVLAASSLALQWATKEAQRGRMESLRATLAAGFLLATLFLAGQIQAWRELNAAGYVLADNPANSFFYILTGLHGLHIFGGLVVLGRTTGRAFATNVPPERLRSSLHLCAVYFHFMLAVWLILLAVFAGWANSFADLCLQLLN